MSVDADDLLPLPKRFEQSVPQSALSDRRLSVNVKWQHTIAISSEETLLAQRSLCLMPKDGPEDHLDVSR